VVINKIKKLSDILQKLIQTFRRKANRSHYPRSVVVVAHGTKEILSVVKDFRSLANSMQENHGALVTMKKNGLTLKVTDSNRNQRELGVTIRDTRLLSKDTDVDLKELGDLCVRSDQMKDIVREDEMANLFRVNRQKHDELAKFRAFVPACYLLSLEKLFSGQVDKFAAPATIGRIAEQFVKGLWGPARKRLKILGKERFKAGEVYIASIHDRERFLTECYHGGRNESFYFGPSPEGEWSDIDLSAAYPTAMATIGRPIWQSMTNTRELEAILAEDVLGFAKVEFKFPPETRFPCIPVRIEENLIFPLKGSSYVTGPELRLAKKLGCEIQVVEGVTVEVDPNERPFEVVVKKLISLRSKAKNRMGKDIWKLVSLNLYGKVAQGIEEKRTSEGSLEKKNPSSLTQVVFAAQASGIVRAAVGELLASVPSSKEVISVTTDGLLTNASIDLLESKPGVILESMRSARKRMTGNSSILEVKKRAKQILSWKTRGQATLARMGDDQILAKAGISPPGDLKTKQEQNRWIIDSFLRRDPFARFKSLRRPSLAQLVEGVPMKPIEVLRRLNMEFDFGRAPAQSGIRYVHGWGAHLFFATRPLEDKEEFLSWRSGTKIMRGDYDANSGPPSEDSQERELFRSLKTPDDLEYLKEIVAIQRMKQVQIRVSSDATGYGQVGPRAELQPLIFKCIIRLLARGKIDSNLSQSQLSQKLNGLFGMEVIRQTVANAAKTTSEVPRGFLPRTEKVLGVLAAIFERLPADLENELEEWLLEPSNCNIESSIYEK
tara:strand:- start:430 stop:2763 length:2334 start_codon:yes stop_codon:yes gene_type:complete